VTLQPLQGFSRKYVAGDDRLYSYLDTGAHAVEPLTLPDKSPEALVFDEIQLDDLVRFFKNPYKAYYNKVLGIYYGEEQVLLPETELFSLDKLQEWSLKQKLLLSGPDPAALQEFMLKTGGLPLKNMAGVALQQVDEMVEPVRALYADYTRGGQGQLLPLEISIGDSVLSGTLSPVFDGKLLQVSWSKKESKYLIEAYIRYLAGAAAGLLSGLSFLSGSKYQKIFEATPLPAKEAERRLKDLVSVYKKGFEKMAPFYPDFKIDPDKVEELTMVDFLKLVDDSLNNFQYPCEDPYIMPEYEKGIFDQESILAEYKAICQKIIVPLRKFFPSYYA
jgi:exodeoxyribonuclease V gamma subunit